MNICRIIMKEIVFVYSGTHDNETLLGYFDSLPEKGYTYLQDYTGVKKRRSWRMP